MDNISKIKEKLDIADVVGSYIDLKKAGKNYKACCPFHSEDTPSFMVSPELQIYKCFGCGEAGDIFKFVQKIEGIEFSGSLEILAERAGIKLEKSDFDNQSQLKKKIYLINEISAKFYNYLLTKHETGKKALDYVKSQRRLKDETISEFKIGYAPEHWDILFKFLTKKGFKQEDLLESGVVIKSQKGTIIDKFRGRVVFPLTGIDGKVLGFTGRTIFGKDPKYLNTSDTLVFHKTYFLFGLDKNKVEIKTKGAIFVEGQMDLLSAWQAGIKNLVSVSGTALTNSQLDILQRYTNDLTLCFDSDDAGINAIYRAVDLAEKKNFNVKIAPIPEEYKDLDELIVKDIKKAKEILADGISAYDFFITTKLRKYDKGSAMGKKQIMDELVPLFSKISNKVLLDHYTKQIATELDLSEETVTTSLKKGKYLERSYETQKPQIELKKFTADNEAYFLALILKADLDTAKKHLYKLGPKSFLNPNAERVFAITKDYLIDRKTPLNINSLLKNFEDGLEEWVAELYMWDIGLIIDLEDSAKIDKEIEEAVKRIKKNASKRELKELTKELILAEAEKNSKLVAKLTDKMNKLTKSLVD